MKTTIKLVFSLLVLLSITSCSSIPAKKSKEHAGLFPICKEGTIGYIDATGKVVITPQFKAIGGSDGCSAGEFQDGLALVNVGYKYGYIDKTGKFVINPQFEVAMGFSEGFAFVKKDGKYGVIDTSGTFIAEPQFELGTEFSEGLALVVQNGDAGYIDKSGKMVILPQFARGDNFSDGLALVTIGDNQEQGAKCGYIDTAGKIAISPRFVHCGRFSEGHALVREGEWGNSSAPTVLINQKGDVISKGDYWRDFREGLAPVCQKAVGVNAQCGYKDSKGEWIIKPTFYQAYPFAEGLAYVVLDDKRSGYVDKTGKVVISIGESGLEDQPFFGGLALVATNGKRSYIDKTGKAVWTGER